MCFFGFNHRTIVVNVLRYLGEKRRSVVVVLLLRKKNQYLDLTHHCKPIMKQNVTWKNIDANYDCSVIEIQSLNQKKGIILNTNVVYTFCLNYVLPKFVVFH